MNASNKQYLIAAAMADAEDAQHEAKLKLSSAIYRSEPELVIAQLRLDVQAAQLAVDAAYAEARAF